MTYRRTTDLFHSGLDGPSCGARFEVPHSGRSSPCLLDVRTAGEFAKTPVPGSYFVPLDRIAEHAQKLYLTVGDLPPNAESYAWCAASYR